eukprot:CAMPEP_0181289226 /NCGR_PEP_ID=MMETSP1101-20121128/768_1 /TAXON_ID=46948 /ORGANISM="Rhodomonas abbreviata, Strain Caron Lab Isolate" /LENGTH=298 /DNA_ID=CAMNT_0023393431 /DNA_START=3815 /DNA_END=4713 /DNA_ORIENTATION=+
MVGRPSLERPPLWELALPPPPAPFNIRASSQPHFQLGVAHSILTAAWPGAATDTGVHCSASRPSVQPPSSSWLHQLSSLPANPSSSAPFSALLFLSAFPSPLLWLSEERAPPPLLWLGGGSSSAGEPLSSGTAACNSLLLFWLAELLSSSPRLFCSPLRASPLHSSSSLIQSNASPSLQPPLSSPRLAFSPLHVSPLYFLPLPFAPLRVSPSLFSTSLHRSPPSSGSCPAPPLLPALSPVAVRPATSPAWRSPPRTTASPAHALGLRQHLQILASMISAAALLRRPSFFSLSLGDPKV